MMCDAFVMIGSSAVCAWYRTVCQAPSARHIARGSVVARPKLRYAHISSRLPLERAIAFVVSRRHRHVRSVRLSTHALIVCDFGPAARRGLHSSRPRWATARGGSYGMSISRGECRPNAPSFVPCRLLNGP